MGGDNHSSNLISLTVKQHAIAHKRLFMEFFDWRDMEAYISLKAMIGREESIWNKLTKPKTEEHKQKISNSIKDWHKTRKANKITKKD